MFSMGPAFFKAPSATLALSGSFAAATVGTAYSSSIPISGGLEPYSLTGGTGVSSGSLDSGFSLSITGTMGARFLTLSCASPATADTMSFIASVDSTDSQTATSAQSVVVAAYAAAAWDPAYTSSRITLSSGNLLATDVGGGVLAAVLGSPGWSTGVHYFEVVCGYSSGGDYGLVGVGPAALTAYPGSTAGSYGYYQHDGSKYNSATATAYGAAYGNGDVIGVKYDAAAGTITFYKNGVSQGVAYSGISGTFYPAAGLYATGATFRMQGNAADILYLPSGASAWGA